ncbi:MAG: glucose-1-phosphate thymidylyltransferase RfbA [Melioribacteraceae bacterium]|nr:glucose-1-phosphate thymidylyltransferase RfbA [Melioribacteraceae bacterium]
MKGIILAGGAGSRLYPITKVYSKQLAVIYDKPLIYYPLSLLMLGGIREVLIISTVETIPLYKLLFGNGSQIGMKIEYAVQDAPNGIAEAFTIGADFIGDDSVSLVLGDNIFYGKLNFLYNAYDNFKSGGTVFAYRVTDPERYGVVEFDENNKVLSLEEKPKNPKSNFAVPGIYIFDNSVVEIAKNLKPSARGELEITDVNNIYLQNKNLTVQLIGRGVAWLDTGTPASLLQASNFFGVIEERQGLKVACIEEIAFKKNFINKDELNSLISEMPNSFYRDYLIRMVGE